MATRGLPDLLQTLANCSKVRSVILRVVEDMQTAAMDEGDA